MTPSGSKVGHHVLQLLRDGELLRAQADAGLAGGALVGAHLGGDPIPDAAGVGGTDARALEDVGVCGIGDSGGEMLMDLTSLLVSPCWSALGARRC